LLAHINDIRQQIETVIVGQHKMVDQMLVAILANGHVLLEGVPGVAKTITAKLLARISILVLAGYNSRQI
jgi:MoxR-like ATPase